MDLRLEGRCFVVAGASRGIGRAVGRALLDEGASVVLTSRGAEALRATAEDLEAGAPGRVMALPGDLADPALAEQLVAAAVARFGSLQGALVNGPSPLPGGPLDADEPAWREAFESVLLGGLRLARAVAAGISPDDEGLSGTAGSILFVLSTSARQPVAGLSASNALRPGQAMLVRELADHLAPRGVRVNALLPGRVDTDRTAALDALEGLPEIARRRNEGIIPLGRYGTAEEVAAAAVFLLSPVSSYVTGALLPLDGGLLRSP